MKALALALLLLSFDASAACRLQFLGGNNLDMRAREGRMERVVQLRLTCDEQTQGVIMVEPQFANHSRWGADIVSVTVDGHDMREPLHISANPDGKIIELYVATRLHRYSEAGDETFPLAVRFMY